MNRVNRLRGGLMALLLLLSGGLSAGAQDAKVKQAATRAFNAAGALQNAGLYPRAAEKWKAFIGAYPKDMRLDRAHYYWGICLLQTQKYSEAAQAFQTVITRWPKFNGIDGVWFNLGMTRANIEEAVSRLHSAFADLQ